MSFTTYEVHREGGLNDRGERHYTRRFVVVSTLLAVGPAEVSSAVGYTLYESYNVGTESDAYAILKRVNVAPHGSEIGCWEVTLEYDSAQNAVDRGISEPGLPGVAPSEPGQAGQGGAGTQNQDPAARPWVIKWGSVQTQRLVTSALDHDTDEAQEVPVASSAGQPFDSPLMVETADTTLSITAFTRRIDATKIRRFMNRVNRDTFLGVWDRFQARVTRYEQTSVYENGAFYWQTDITIQFREEGWNPVVVLDAGTLQKKSQILPLQPILDRTGNPVSTPVPLDGFGEPLKAGQPFAYRRFDIYKTADFNKII